MAVCILRKLRERDAAMMLPELRQGFEGGGTQRTICEEGRGRVEPIPLAKKARASSNCCLDRCTLRGSAQESSTRMEMQQRTNRRGVVQALSCLAVGAWGKGSARDQAAAEYQSTELRTALLPTPDAFMEERTACAPSGEVDGCARVGGLRATRFSTQGSSNGLCRQICLFLQRVRCAVGLKVQTGLLQVPLGSKFGMASRSGSTCRLDAAQQTSLLLACAQRKTRAT